MPLTEQSNPYNAPVQNPTAKELLVIDQHKALYLKKIQAELELLLKPLEEKTAPQDLPISSDSISRWDKAKPIANKILYPFFLTVGLAQDAAQSFVFSTDFFLQIDFLGRIAALVLSFVYTFLESILFYAFEVSLLKSVMGLSSKEEMHSALDCYKQQVEAADAINHMLTDFLITKTTLRFTAYAQYLEIASQMNADLKTKKGQFSKPQEIPILYQLLKWGIIAFGAFSKIVGSYFMATSLLTTISLSFSLGLEGSPLTWVLFGLFALASLGLYRCMEAKSMGELVTGGQKFTDVQEQLSKFKPRTLFMDSTFFTQTHELRTSKEVRAASLKSK